MTLPPRKLDATATLGDAWAIVVRERDLLLRVAAPFLFLPAFALALLVPAQPQLASFPGEGEPQMLAYVTALSDWVRVQGGWLLLAYAIGYLGMATIYALHLDRERPDVRAALGRAVRLLPRYVLAMALIAIPAAVGLALWVLPGLYVLGRAMPTGPVLLAERPISATKAIGRSIALSRGAGLALAWLASLPLLGGWVGSWPLLSLDRWLREGHGNPVALGIVDAAAAAVAMLAGLATAVIAIAAYRRLAR